MRQFHAAVVTGRQHKSSQSATEARGGGVCECVAPLVPLRYELTFGSVRAVVPSPPSTLFVTYVPVSAFAYNSPTPLIASSHVRLYAVAISLSAL